MSPVLSALLCLDKLPRPSLSAENGSLVPLGRNVTLRCRGSPEATEYFLVKYTGFVYERISSELSREDEVEFSIPSMTLSDTGTYSCHYKREYYWSELSKPLELVATGVYHSPSLSAWPNSTVATGQAVTLQCHSQLSHDRSALYKDGEQVTKAWAQSHAQGSQANFLIPVVDSTHGGTYRCYSFQSLSPREWSSPSDPVKLRITGPRGLSPSPTQPQQGLWGGGSASAIPGRARLTQRASEVPRPRITRWAMSSASVWPGWCSSSWGSCWLKPGMVAGEAQGELPHLLTKGKAELGGTEGADPKDFQNPAHTQTEGGPRIWGSTPISSLGGKCPHHPHQW
ncbi:platelet glycoprotein VI-like isoform 2-T2 [Sarcophilus harrisii]